MRCLIINWASSLGAAMKQILTSVLFVVIGLSVPGLVSAEPGVSQPPSFSIFMSRTGNFKVVQGKCYEQIHVIKGDSRGELRWDEFNCIQRLRDASLFQTMFHVLDLHAVEGVGAGRITKAQFGEIAMSALLSLRDNSPESDSHSRIMKRFLDDIKEIYRKSTIKQ